MNKGLTPSLFKIASVLWVIWGLVHFLAGVMTIAQATPQAVMGIADAVNPETLDVFYPEAAGALINQHGFNLLWIGLVTAIGGLFIWKQNRNAVLVTALIGGLTDVGYFIFMDMGGYVNFAPGTVMTIISASAIITSFIAIFKNNEIRSTL